MGLFENNIGIPFDDMSYDEFIIIHQLLEDLGEKMTFDTQTRRLRGKKPDWVYFAYKDDTWQGTDQIEQVVTYQFIRDRLSGDNSDLIYKDKMSNEKYEI